MPNTPIQDEPESTVGRKPGRWPPHEEPAQGAARSGSAIRREEGDETEAGSEIRDRERDDPGTVRGIEE